MKNLVAVVWMTKCNWSKKLPINAYITLKKEGKYVWQQELFVKANGWNFFLPLDISSWCLCLSDTHTHIQKICKLSCTGKVVQNCKPQHVLFLNSSLVTQSSACLAVIQTAHTHSIILLP